MRPKIPDTLAERVESVLEKGGYASASDLVRDATRRRVEEIEEKWENESASDTENDD